jgi:two-component system, cell cycle response regulator
MSVTDRTTRPTLVEFTAAVRETEPVEIDFGGTVTTTEQPELDLGGDTEITGRPASLIVVSGPTMGQVHVLSDEAIIGRAPLVDIVIEDPAVSRRHVRLLKRSWDYVVEDLGSINGTYVNGARIMQPYELSSGERIQLGPRVILRFAYLDPAEEAMHRQLFDSSTRDPLTGSYNKKYLSERLSAEVAHALRHKSSLEIVVFDLDHFKHINDRYGHLIGDSVLRAVADRVHSLIRSEDVFSRFGGEEFVVLCRGSDAVRLAERIRVAISRIEVATERGIVQVTTSLGVANLQELGTSGSARALLDKADLRLLEAKRRGRNQIRATD